MKNLLLLLLLLLTVLVGCKKEDVGISDFIDGVPDSRFAGIWNGSDGEETKYTFSMVDNKGNYFLRTGGLIIAYNFYWRKSSTNGRFEIKRDFGDKVWTDFGLEFIDTKNIKIEGKKFVK